MLSAKKDGFASSFFNCMLVVVVFFSFHALFH